MLRADLVPNGAPIPPPVDQSQSSNFFAPGQPEAPTHQQPQFGVSFVNTSMLANHPGATGQRYYTIQRVNGNGGNGKGDGVPGPHKHTLEESDRVKKNSIQRLTLKKDKEEKKTQVRSVHPLHGPAAPQILATVEQHGKLLMCKGPVRSLSTSRVIISQRFPHNYFSPTFEQLCHGFILQLPLNGLRIWLEQLVLYFANHNQISHFQISDLN